MADTCNARLLRSSSVGAGRSAVALATASTDEHPGSISEITVSEFLPQPARLLGGASSSETCRPMGS